ncbi:MAG: exosortase/archaeosortase family protein [Phycisphaerae bacterium]|nr:exosortase/archaeosortase family protein [Phycisphaerae bacterium]
MTTLSPNASQGPLPKGGADAAFPGGIRVGVVALAVLIGAAFCAVFFRWILRQFGPGGFSAGYFEDWGHAYVVPLVSGWAVWSKRAEIGRLKPEAYWPGFGVMLLGIVTYVYFTTGYSNHMFQGFSLILSLAGLLLLVFGPRVFPIFVFPLGYLGFAVTISEMIMLKVTWGLKLAASQGAWALLNLVGIDTDLKGNNLEVYHNGVMTPLNVADACSGMRMVVAFIALAAAVAFLSCRQWWQRIAVILLAVPVAVSMNVARVAVLGAATLFNTNLASGGAHTLIGTLLLVPAFFIFMGCVWLLQRLDPERSAAPVAVKPKPRKKAVAS